MYDAKQVAAALRAEKVAIPSRIKKLRQEIAVHERAIYKHARMVCNFPEYQEPLDHLIDLCMSKYREILDLHVRQRTIGGDIYRLEHPLDKPDRRTRAYAAPRKPRGKYKTKYGKRILTPMQP